MTGIKRYVYISDRKVKTYKDQHKRKTKLTLDWEASLKFLLAELKGKVAITQEADTIFQDLEKVIQIFENDHSVGNSTQLYDLNYPWIKISGNFRLEVMKSEKLSPHFRWLYLETNGFEKQIIYLVGSLVYGIPRTQTWREPEQLYRKFKKFKRHPFLNEKTSIPKCIPKRPPSEGQRNKATTSSRHR